MFSIKSVGTGNRIRTLSVLLVIAVGVVAGLELTNTTHIFHKAPLPPAIPSDTVKNSSGDNKESASSGSSPTSNTSQSSKVAAPSAGVNSSVKLIQPYGDLVSNHRPGQNGSDTKEQSVCNTTPGAKCYIKFTNTKSGATTKLSVLTVGRNGSAIWSWDANDLSSGSWQITAVASLNGQTKSVTDDIKLIVP